MSLLIPSSLERLFAFKSDTSNDRLPLLLFGGVLFVLFFTLLWAAFLPVEESFGYEGLLLDDDDVLLGGMRLFFLERLPSSFALAVLTTVLWLQHLKSHIGEKRPDSEGIHSTSLFARFSKTTLFFSVVFLLFLTRVLSRGNPLTLVFARDRSARFRSKKRFHFIFGGL